MPVITNTTRLRAWSIRTNAQAAQMRKQRHREQIKADIERAKQAKIKKEGEYGNDI